MQSNIKYLTLILATALSCACANVEVTWQDGESCIIEMWKGDKAYAVLDLTSGTDREFTLKAKVDGPLEVSAVFVETVIGDMLDTTRFSQCGSREMGKFGEIPCDDRLGEATSGLIAGQPKKVWVSVKTPCDAASGEYSGYIKVAGKKLPFKVNVLDEILPGPEDWKFDLNLWQNPYAVARYYNVPLWSDEHFKYMRPVMEMLRDAGQKYITTTILNRPWDGQTEDPFGSMVVKERHEDGSWSYDYTVFDKYVQWMMDLGINKGIDCYSMIPWRLEFDYRDAVTGRDTTVFADTHSEAYRDYWGSFIADFSRHLKEKGWFGITAIAMDERSEEDMQAAIAVIRSVDPDMKISLAGLYHEAIDSELHYLCVAMLKKHPAEIIEQRRAEGKKTTFYVCCSEKYPNTFLASKPDEAAWLPVYSLAKGYDGFLRWSYNSWTEDPCADARFRTWPAGDCYIVYPGGHSSVRFEKLSEGIRICEKLRILSARWTRDAQNGDSAAAAKLTELRSILDRFTFEELTAEGATPAVDAIREFVR